jgi:PKD repeat protein
VAALGLALTPSAQATTVNVVPNPGFEQGGCGAATPDICGWEPLDPSAQISQDTTNPHSGSASMSLTDWSGYGYAATDPGFCTTMSPGTHAASFWYRTGDSGDPNYNVSVMDFSAYFYPGSDCTGSGTLAQLEAQPILDNAWHQVSGTLVAPTGTVSAIFLLDILAGCDLCTWVTANFDDLDVEDDLSTDTTPPDTTITSGPSATTTSTSATFAFSATEPSTFQCALDGSVFTACASPTTYSGLAQGSHTFDVRAVDLAGNTDPTPAEQSWTIVANTPPTAQVSFSCTALQCSFDGSGSSDPDGTIASYDWSFGDGTSGSGPSPTHTYTQAGSYTATLTVTDNDGATASEAQTVTLIALSARGYKVKGLEKADLSWNGPNGTSFDVYRNGGKIATVQATAYTDNIDNRGSGSYAYKVCAPALSTCSNDATVNF